MLEIWTRNDTAVSLPDPVPPLLVAGELSSVSSLTGEYYSNLSSSDSEQEDVEWSFILQSHPLSESEYLVLVISVTDLHCSSTILILSKLCKESNNFYIMLEIWTRKMR